MNVSLPLADEVNAPIVSAAEPVNVSLPLAALVNASMVCDALPVNVVASSCRTAIARLAQVIVVPEVSARSRHFQGGRDGKRLALRQAGVLIAGGVRRLADDLDEVAAVLGDVQVA